MARKKRNKQQICPNCSFKFKDALNYCPNCGQENHNIIQPFKAVLQETLETTISLDTRFWRSFITLLFKPGKLTVDYISGHRFRHVPPIRLYAFLSIVYFFVLSLTASSPDGNTNLRVVGPAIDTSLIAMDDLQEAQLDSGKLAAFQRDMPRFGSMTDAEIDSALVSMESKPTQLNRTILRKVSKIQGGGWEYFRKTLYQAISLGMLVLMPVFGLLLMLVYRRKKRYYIEHLFFSLHLHSFFFVMGIPWLLIAIWVPSAWLNYFFILLFLTYVSIALKRVYAGSWGATIGREVLLLLGYSITFLFFFVIVLLGTVLSF